MLKSIYIRELYEDFVNNLIFLTSKNTLLKNCGLSAKRDIYFQRIPSQGNIYGNEIANSLA